ncbi:MAG TPA: tetratricopeptide repeat protein [Chitinophagaceae bacterium]|nr:tetratricopeptide repeat protein [Chitinophagaceae bacterium]
MKKTTITFLISGLLFINGLKAQSLQEGINHLNADRFKSAVAVFKSLLAVNPNNIEATYWLGQTYLDNDVNDSARQLYQRALMTSANAPLLLVGMGHVELLDKKTNEARQRFEAAITMTRNKKGDDPFILYAIGRANVDAKAGDVAYAIEKLEAAALKDPKNPEIYLQLGNAYRKARPGEGGGQAYTSYKKALELNPAYAVADLRLAKLFESQRNWELVLQYLNEAVAKDPKFAPAYYELFYYYFYRQNYPEAEAQLKKYITVTDDPVQNDYLYAQMCYGNKDYNCTITKATSVVNAMGSMTKPKVYKLLAYAYFDKGDYANAQKYVNDYFAKEKPEGFIPLDYKLKADILSKTGGTPDEVYATYIQGAALDTVLTSKIDFLKQGAEYFKAKGDSLSRNKEGDLRLAIIKLKPNPGQRDFFDAGFAFYQGKNYTRSDSLFTVYSQKWPEETFGWQWKFNIQRALDTTMEKGLAVQPAIKYLEVLEKDTAKNKSAIISTAGYLAGYYANVAKDKAKAIEYLEKMRALDPNNETIKNNLEILKKPQKQPATSPKGNAAPKAGNPKPEPVAKSKTTRATKNAVVKK